MSKAVIGYANLIEMVIKVGENPYIFTLTDLLYKGGYIISIKPTPKGMFVVPE